MLNVSKILNVRGGMSGVVSLFESSEDILSIESFKFTPSLNLISKNPSLIKQSLKWS